MQAAREFVADIAELVSMPEVYVSIRELLQRPDTRIEDFAEVVARDSLLSVRILRLAGSDYFGFPRRCEDLYQAISLIGLVQLHDLILGSLCIRSFASLPAELFNLEAYWRYCVRCGIAARSVGQYCRGDGHFVFFTLGLLHEIGHAALFLKEPETEARLVQESLEQNRDLAELERERFGFDYRQVGQELAGIWHLPPAYEQVIAHHLDPGAADSRFRPAVEVVYLAHELCNAPEAFDDARAASMAERFDGLRGLPANLGEIVAAEVDRHGESILTLLWPWDEGLERGVAHA